MISAILSRLVILIFGTLYPAYASYKAVKTKNIKEYVKWMMYWIVFALFTTAETFTDVLFSWLPFYYEIKIVLVLWLLSPATKGSSILYRKFVHPTLSSREHEIDEYISKAKEQSYKQVLDLGSRGVTALMQTALKSGGGIVNHLRKSYSLGDLNDSSIDAVDSLAENDVVITDPRLLRRLQSVAMAGASTSASTSNLYFSEMDVRAGQQVVHVRSVEDISSGYSSGEGLYVGQPPKLQAREGLARAGSLTRSRTTRVTRSSVAGAKKSASDESDDNEVFSRKLQSSDQLNEDPTNGSSEEEFCDTLDVHESTVVNRDQIVNLYDRKLLTACLENLEKFTKFVDNINGRQVPQPTIVIKELDENPEKIDDSNSSENLESTVDRAERGGKYHKKPAPLPPKSTENKEDATSAIKATLILKPGVVRPVGNTESEPKEIFINSPKSKRKTLISKSKIDSLSKLIRLPKKFHKDDQHLKPKMMTKEKRSSWHDFFERPKLGETKWRSKSDNNLVEDKSMGSNLSGSRMSIRVLNVSPLAHRRLKIIRRFIDEDID